MRQVFNFIIFQLQMIALFIVALLVFAYMCYVLVKPEKF